MNEKLKKTAVRLLPYLFVALAATCLGKAWRMAEDADATQTLLNLPDALGAAFSPPIPSLHPFDLLTGAVMAALLRAAVYLKGKNARKYRKNREYGSARWGTREDIAPYIDPVFQKNVILTQTERLTMNNRPQGPADGTEQKRAGRGRKRQRQDPLFHQAKPDAVPQLLCP